MRKFTLFVSGLLLVAAGLFAQDVTTEFKAEFRLTSRTSFGINLDNPREFGLKQTFPEFGTYFQFWPWQPIGNTVESDSPRGFVDFTLHLMELRFAGGSNPDDNNTGNYVTPGWNNNTQSTGYWSPFYLQGLVTGIGWDDYIIQLAAGGDDEFWKPWNRKLDNSNESLFTSWAYMDTRVQFRRDVITNASQGETFFWTFSAADSPMDSVTADISGTMISGGYYGEEFTAVLKGATEYAWDSSVITDLNQNGVALGIDFGWSPLFLEGLKTMGSVTSSWNYGPDSEDFPVNVGILAGYSFGLPVYPDVLIEPYAGFDSIVEGENFTWELAGGVSIRWPGTEGWAFDYLQGRTGYVSSGMSLAYKVDNTLGSDLQHNLLFTLFEDSGDLGLFYGMGSEVVVEWFDFFNAGGTSKLLASLYVDYTLTDPSFSGSIIPWCMVFYDYLIATAENDLQLQLGIKTPEIIPNTEFGLVYGLQNLIIDSNAGEVFDPGVLEIYTEITF